MTSLLLPLSLAVMFAAIPLVVMASRRSRNAAALTTGGAMVVSLGLLAPLAPSIQGSDALITRWDWLPEWGINPALRLDGLSLLYAILILGIGVLVVLYATYYMAASDRLGRFFGLLLGFAGSMLGLVLSENLIQLVVFWEMTSIASFLLISYKHEAHDARIAARMALAVTGAGGLALLAGVMVLGSIVGSYSISVVLSSGDLIRNDELYPVTLVLILIGAFTKSAQFPFHFWLPNAMAAPTPVSAYLHSATMVKAGVFALARFYPVLAGTDLWLAVVVPVGAITLAYGAYLAMLQHDFKGLLAYSTISHLGLITLLIGLDTSMSTIAGLFHIINHAIFKASLFMAAGIIDHECGTRDMRRINGLIKYMPYTAALGIVAAGSMAGVPLLNGFLSKEMFFAETIELLGFDNSGWLLPAFATVAGMLTVAYSARFIYDVFFGGEPVDLPRQPQEPVRWIRIPVDVLVLLCLLVGLFPQYTVGHILDVAAAATLGGTVPYFELAVWHGFDLPLIMSLIAIAGGLIYYSQSDHVIALHDRYAPKLHSRVAFDRLYRELAAASQVIIAGVDNRSLQRYVVLLIGSILVLGGWAYFSAVPATLRGPEPGLAPDLATLSGLVALVVGSVGATIYHRQRLTALVFLGVVGLVVSLAFVRFSAPDLALTQLAVEVATITLLLLGLRFIPAQAPLEASRVRHVRDIGLALAGGTGLALLTYAMLTRPFSTISDFYLQNAVSGGGGTNVVNIILVDFRGFDTLGESTLLAMVAVAALAILDGLRLRPYPPPAVREADRHPIMLAMLMRPLLPLALVVSLYILLRGHNLPGGGFIAGLIASVALILQYVASGIDLAQARLRVDFLRVLAMGLALAAGTGLASVLSGYPFLTSAHGRFHLPLIGDIELASAMAFDLGVFLVVVGAVLVIMSEFGVLCRRELPRVRAGKRR
ncbi:MAG: monovalent cation/H+ antiporter subunit A [Hyphomicrobiaceae bacterium]|nr:monovalent cation/H+ antiporter subunit A [Hyphomicrobiaceae bacterium]